MEASCGDFAACFFFGLTKHFWKVASGEGPV